MEPGEAALGRASVSGGAGATERAEEGRGTCRPAGARGHRVRALARACGEDGSALVPREVLDVVGVACGGACGVSRRARCGIERGLFGAESTGWTGLKGRASGRLGRRACVLRVARPRALAPVEPLRRLLAG